MRPRHLAPLTLLVLTGHLGCGPDPRADEVASSAGRLTAPNGMTQNSLSSNALFQNALFQNSLMQNSLMQNSLMQNSLMQNGLLSGVLWQDALWQQSPAAREALRANANTRDLLKYVYECAMGPEQSTVLDPGPGGANLELHGLVGLAPGWGKSGGACDESCQRWVTACVLARTNAYGVKVDLSMRAPDDAPAHIKAALAVTAEERAAYPLREGAFYGNLFRQEGQPDGTAVMAPRFYACAGPGSNIPQVTKRFCSSQGNDGPIDVPGTCEPRPEFPRAACLGVSGDKATGAMHDCYTSIDPANQGEHYPEVITVYLKHPIEVCGNFVCEQDEEDATNAGAEGACPSDCHPGGWTRSFAGFLTGDSSNESQDYPSGDAWVRTSALGPDDTIVLAGVAPTTVDLGGGALDTGPDGNLYGVLAKYGPDGQLLWSKRFGFGFAGRVAPASVAVASDGSIGVALNEFGSAGGGGPHMWLGKFTGDGELAWSKLFVNEQASGRTYATELAFDDENGLVVVGNFIGTVNFGNGVMISVPDTAMPRVCVLKVSSGGVAQWAFKLPHELPMSSKRTIAVDHGGNVLLSANSSMGLNTGTIWKLNGASGQTVWMRHGEHGGIAVDSDDNVYATGMLGGNLQSYGFELPPTAQDGDFFVVKYSASGSPLGARVASPVCAAPNVPCGNGGFEGHDIAFDADGNVVVGVRGGAQGVTIDFGAGPFRTHATPDVFVAAFSPELEPLWSKQVPMVLAGTLSGMQLDRQGRVVVNGTFAGSMLVDDRMLVSTIPEQETVGNTFLGVFSSPDPSDVTAPDIDDGGAGNEPVSEGEVDRMPKPMTLEATSAAGAEVFFLPPTSTDAGLAGVSVDCSPPPNTVFPIGPTTVTCVATDPLGNQAFASFDVTVVDHLGPAFGNAPPSVTVEPAGPDGTPVTFDPPYAIDLVDGPRAVACEPASGSIFPLGTTMVTCTASDASGNVATRAFPVHVREGGLRCGNGQLDPGEACDDGNPADGDGCSSACAVENRPPDCSSPSASPDFLLASTGQMWAPVSIDGVTDPDGDPVTISAIQVWQDEPISPFWCPGGTCADATLEPLTVRAERDTWSPTDPQPDGRVYHIDFRAVDAHGAQCVGVVTVCVLRHYGLLDCGDGGPLYNSLGP
ncbi:MAG TPA: HYR domain-containing protein [Polyangiaceae bacterium]|nr:HYR domain-containing protein [Polyangiaceae bacterium]